LLPLAQTLSVHIPVTERSVEPARACHESCLEALTPICAKISGLLPSVSLMSELSIGIKEWILTHMREIGALESTLTLLREIQDELLDELSSLEQNSGLKNLILKWILLRLWL